MTLNDTTRLIRARLEYLEQALTPGTSINAGTTFYEGKGASLQAELVMLRNRLRIPCPDCGMLDGPGPSSGLSGCETCGWCY